MGSGESSPCFAAIKVPADSTGEPDRQNPSSPFLLAQRLLGSGGEKNMRTRRSTGPLLTSPLLLVLELGIGSWDRHDCATWHQSQDALSMTWVMRWSFLTLFNELCPCFCSEAKVKPTDEVATPRCGRSPSRVLVYMFVPPRSEASKEILRTMAIEKEMAEEVEIYNWKLIKGEHHYESSQQSRRCVWKHDAFQALFNFSGFS